MSLHANWVTRGRLSNTVYKSWIIHMLPGLTQTLAADGEDPHYLCRTQLYWLTWAIWICQETSKFIHGTSAHHYNRCTAEVSHVNSRFYAVELALNLELTQETPAPVGASLLKMGIRSGRVCINSSILMLASGNLSMKATLKNTKCDELPVLNESAHLSSLVTFSSQIFTFVWA